MVIKFSAWGQMFYLMEEGGYGGSKILKEFENIVFFNKASKRKPPEYS